MRRVTAALFQSLDGVVESPELWQFDSFDADLAAFEAAATRHVDTAIFGRTTFEQWAGYWPTADEQTFADFINPLEKYVVSRTLRGQLRWTNSHVMPTDLLPFIAELSRGDGGDIAVMGSISVVRQLLVADMLDALTLIVYPVIGALGRRLFDDTGFTQRLKLIDTERTASGTLLLRYEPLRQIS